MTFRIYGMSRKDARTLVGDYVRLAWRIANEKLGPKGILEELSEIGKDYPIRESVKDLMNIDCYNGWTEELRYFSSVMTSTLQVSKVRN